MYQICIEASVMPTLARLRCFSLSHYSPQPPLECLAWHLTSHSREDGVHLPTGLPLTGAVPSWDEPLEMPSSLTFFPKDSCGAFEGGAWPSCASLAWLASSPLSAIPWCTRSPGAVQASAALQGNPYALFT